MFNFECKLSLGHHSCSPAPRRFAERTRATHNSMRVFSEKMDEESKKVQEACREEVSGLVKQVLLKFLRVYM